MPSSDPAKPKSTESPLSLNRLREAFASMLGVESKEQGARSEKQGAQARTEKTTSRPQPLAPSPQRPCEISPRTVVEAILFVGRPDNAAISSRELAASMRGVSPGEVDAVIRELNERYDTDDAPYHIEGTAAGYRLAMRPDFDRMRDKFYGRVREAKLTTAALECLSIVAYNQPVTTDQISELRGAPSGAAVSTLVRRKLVRQDRPDDSAGPPSYSTTERFLKLFGLENLSVLPRSEELEKM